METRNTLENDYERPKRKREMSSNLFGSDNQYKDENVLESDSRSKKIIIEERNHTAYDAPEFIDISCLSPTFNRNETFTLNIKVVPVEDESVPLENRSNIGTLFLCIPCALKFSRSHLFFHVKKVHGCLICTNCLKIFPDTDSLVLHLKNEHKFTEKLYSSPEHLSKERPCYFVCRICEQEFVGQDTFLKHSCNAAPILARSGCFACKMKGFHMPSCPYFHSPQSILPAYVKDGEYVNISAQNITSALENNTFQNNAGPSENSIFKNISSHLQDNVSQTKTSDLGNNTFENRTVVSGDDDAQKSVSLLGNSTSQNLTSIGQNNYFQNDTSLLGISKFQNGISFPENNTFQNNSSLLNENVSQYSPLLLENDASHSTCILENNTFKNNSEFFKSDTSQDSSSILKRMLLEKTTPPKNCLLSRKSTSQSNTSFLESSASQNGASILKKNTNENMNSKEKIEQVNIQNIHVSENRESVLFHVSTIKPGSQQFLTNGNSVSLQNYTKGIVFNDDERLIMNAESSAMIKVRTDLTYAPTNMLKKHVLDQKCPPNKLIANIKNDTWFEITTDLSYNSDGGAHALAHVPCEDSYIPSAKKKKESVTNLNIPMDISSAASTTKGDTEKSEDKSQINSCNVLEIDEDSGSSDIAYETITQIELVLIQPMDVMTGEALLKECIRVSYSVCVYCNHAKRIWVNGKQLLHHVLEKHEFQPIVYSKGLRTEVKGLVAKLQNSVQELDNIYVHTDQCGGMANVLVRHGEPFRCFHCSYLTISFEELYTHNQNTHQVVNYRCVMCKHKFYCYSELLCHLCRGVYLPDIRAQFHCCFCTKGDMSASFQLTDHLRECHNACDICLEVSEDQEKLLTHVWNHQCDHFCYECGIPFKSRSEVSSHIRSIHISENVCQRCSYMKRSQVCHCFNPSRIFLCTICSSTFPYDICLKVHQIFHSTGTLHYCNICNKYFQSNKHLSKHKKLKHKNENNLPNFSVLKSLLLSDSHTSTHDTPILNPVNYNENNGSDILKFNERGDVSELQQNQYKHNDIQQSSGSKQEHALQCNIGIHNCEVPYKKSKSDGVLMINEIKNQDMLMIGQNKQGDVLQSNDVKSDCALQCNENNGDSKLEYIGHKPDDALQRSEYEEDGVLQNHENKQNDVLQCNDNQDEYHGNQIDVPSCNENGTLQSNENKQNSLMQCNQNDTNILENIINDFNKEEKPMPQSKENKSINISLNSLACNVAPNDKSSVSIHSMEANHQRYLNERKNVPEGITDNLMNTVTISSRFQDMASTINLQTHDINGVKVSEDNNGLETAVNNEVTPSFLEINFPPSAVGTYHSESEMPSSLGQIYTVFNEHNYFSESVRNNSVNVSDTLPFSQVDDYSQLSTYTAGSPILETYNVERATESCVSVAIARTLFPQYGQKVYKNKILEDLEISFPFNMVNSKGSSLKYYPQSIGNKSVMDFQSPVSDESKIFDHSYSRKFLYGKYKEDKLLLLADAATLFNEKVTQIKLSTIEATKLITSGNITKPKRKRKEKHIIKVDVDSRPHVSSAKEKSKTKSRHKRLRALHTKKHSIKPNNRESLPKTRQLTRCRRPPKRFYYDSSDQENNDSEVVKKRNAYSTSTAESNKHRKKKIIKRSSCGVESQISTDNSIQFTTYCYCESPYDDVSQMIACDGENCDIEWFHFECVGITVPPQGPWFCKNCKKL